MMMVKVSAVVMMILMVKLVVMMMIEIVMMILIVWNVMMLFNLHKDEVEKERKTNRYAYFWVYTIFISSIPV